MANPIPESNSSTNNSNSSNKCKRKSKSKSKSKSTKSLCALFNFQTFALDSAMLSANDAAQRRSETPDTAVSSFAFQEFTDVSARVTVSVVLFSASDLKRLTTARLPCLGGTEKVFMQKLKDRDTGELWMDISRQPPKHERKVRIIRMNVQRQRANRARWAPNGMAMVIRWRWSTSTVAAKNKKGTDNQNQTVYTRTLSDIYFHGHGAPVCTAKTHSLCADGIGSNFVADSDSALKRHRSSKGRKHQKAQSDGSVVLPSVEASLARRSKKKKERRKKRRKSAPSVPSEEWKNCILAEYRSKTLKVEGEWSKKKFKTVRQRSKTGAIWFECCPFDMSSSRCEITTDHFDEAGMVKIWRTLYSAKAASEAAHNDGEHRLFRLDYKGASTYFIEGYPKSGAGEGRDKADARNDQYDGRDSGRCQYDGRKGKDEVFWSDRRVTKENSKREKKVTVDRTVDGMGVDL